MVTPVFYPSLGGMEKFIENLSLNLKERGHDVSIAVFNKTANLPKRALVSGIPVVNYPCKGLTIFPLCLASLSEWKDVDIIHLHDHRFGFISLNILLRLPGIPIVATTHGTFFHTKKNLFLKKLYMRFIASLVGKRMTSIIACSASDKKIVDGWGIESLLIEDGVDSEAFSEANILRKKAPNFLYWGRISKNKRVDRLLEAFNKIFIVLPEAKLTIVGADIEELRDSYETSLVNRGLQDKIRFLGPLPKEDLMREIRAHNYYVSATEYEGFGMSVVEAMASGLIPIVQSIPPFQNIIQHGINGFLIDYDEPAQVAKQIAEIISMDEDSYQSRVKNATVRARDYSWNIKVCEYEAVYNKALVRS